MKKTILLFALTGMFSLTSFSQNTSEPCASTEQYLKDLEKDPKVKALREAADKDAIEIDQILFGQKYKGNGRHTSNEKANNVLKAQGTIYTIPVVFHILHQNGPENITDAQIYSQMAQINKDFSATTPDTANTQTPFKGLEADVQIKFQLATIDPNGNCTNGIIRYNDPNTNWFMASSPFAYTWDRTKYYNVYVVKSITDNNGQSGVAGYSSFPGTKTGANIPADVTVCLHNYIGNMGTSNPTNSHCLTHESGHFFNLYHIWDCCTAVGTACGTDQVSDTPQTKGHNSNCPSGVANQVCVAGVDENPNNYMDYSYCYTMYTAGQATRMRNTIINNVGNCGRANLASAGNLIATGVTTPQICPPIANFHASLRSVCPNAIITFSDSSSNAHPTSWNWSFPGGSLQGGTTVNDSMPKVSYTTPGTYAVSYTATTSGGSGNITKTSYITVLTNVASYNTQFTEGFETTTLPGSDWSIANTAGTNWAVSSAAAATGLKSAKLDNMVNAAGDVSAMESTSFDISSFITPKLTFKYAYKQKASTDNDKLQIFSSTDCGATWTSRWSRNGSTLANVTPASGTAFTPTSGQFLTYTVNINALAGQNNVRFRFVFTADYGATGAVGNNVFVDDINLFDASAGIASVEELVGLNIYPNPSSGTINLDMNLSETHTIAVVVTDVLGRTIETIAAKQYNAGENSLSVAQKKVYQPGVYFINIDVDGKLVTKKVLVQ